MMNINIDTLIPHRNRMKLVGSLIASDENSGKVTTIVKPTWPLVYNNYVDSIICIELIAQTIAASIGSQNAEKEQAGSGFIVEIKNAKFNQTKINTGTALIIAINKLYDRTYYGIFEGRVCSNTVIAEATLHVIKADVKLEIPTNEK